MVQTYNILGRQVGSHYLAIATLVTTGALSYWGLSGKPKTPASEAEEQRRKIGASSKEEEEFVREFIRAAEEEEAKGRAKAGAK